MFKVGLFSREPYQSGFQTRKDDTHVSPRQDRRAAYCAVLFLVVTIVADGWSGRPSPLLHQLILLPAAAMFLFGLKQLLSDTPYKVAIGLRLRSGLMALVLFELWFALLFVYEARHFARFGYQLQSLPTAIIFCSNLALLGLLVVRCPAGWVILLTSAWIYASGLVLSVLSFPLNYLRSDMLPVILWAGTNLLHGVSPYQTMHVGDRLYDFPYLPGVLMAYLPWVATGLDPRLGSGFYLLATVFVIFFAARVEYRSRVAVLLSLFLLCPFLQYRHELYLQPHWLTLAGVFLLTQRRRFGWAAFVFGLSMAVYQFSWVIFPFFLLNGWRRRGVWEVLRLAALSGCGALVLAGPFLRSAAHRISSNTVAQWSSLPHALADPINLSFWMTYVIRPNHLLWLQGSCMIGILLGCCLRGRCRTMVDTMRWMIVAITLFVLLNVIVDGYFFLMLLVLMVIYTCVANGWWWEPPTLEI